MAEKKRFAVYDRRDDFSRYVASQIIQFLKGFDWVYDPDKPEILICVGGDGTILRAIHRYYDQLEDLCLVGFHTGTLGFLTDFTEKDLDELLYFLVKKEYRKEYATLLDIECKGREKVYHAFNEARIGSFSRNVRYDIYIDGEFFEQTVGCGICISTQAGSTAANRSLGGAVVDDGLDIFQLCEIMPVSHRSFSSLQNPYIMNSQRVIEIFSNDFEESELSFDFSTTDLRGVDSIRIRACPKKVCFARYRPYTYFRRLKNLY